MALMKQWDGAAWVEVAAQEGVPSIQDTPVDGATTAGISSNWAYDHLTIWHQPLNDIGIPGQQGFGIGLYPGILPAGYSPLIGTYDPASDNYGNYLYSDRSVVCWIPAFYYRIAHPLNPTYPNYGVNSIDVLRYSAFASVAAANTAGYALHRAFYDGDAVTPKPGFFIDKYQASNNNGIASSIRFGNPLSSKSDHNPFSGLTGLSAGDNIHAGAIKAAKTRGSQWFPTSRFQFAALALLATAHGQAANGTAFCAWYLANKNYPKGNNNNALADVDDTTVKYISDGYPNCGKTGSGDLFAKTTHNGQNCGVADLNGNMWEINLGMTCIATSKTITGASKANPCQITITAHGYATGTVVLLTSVGGMTQLNDRLYTITSTGGDTFTLDGVDSSAYSDFTSGGSATTGTFYAAKPSVAMKDFTSGTTLATDHWGATGVAAMMEPIPVNFATAAAANGIAQRYGNSTNQVLAEATSGDAWRQTGLGLPKAAGMSSGGTNLFGLDTYIQNIKAELCLISGGGWTHSSAMGVWHLSIDHPYYNSISAVGFRCACYV